MATPPVPGRRLGRPLGLPRGRRPATLVLLTLLALIGPGPVAASATAPVACTPGSGAKLAGHRITAAMVQAGRLRCADLTRADLSGLELDQADLSYVRATDATFAADRMSQTDLTGAVLTGADLERAQLTQAVLTGADLSGANLRSASLDQIDAKGAVFRGADVRDANFTQASLQHAVFDDAQVDGADFTQAEVGGAHFGGVRGLTDWSLYLLIGAAAVFVLLAVASIRKAVGRRAGSRVQVQPFRTDLAAIQAAHHVGAAGRHAVPEPAVDPRYVRVGRSPARGILLGLLGSLVVAFGLHLLAGALIGQFSFAFDTLATAVCTQPQCTVGVDSSFPGLFGGIAVVLVGLVLRARA
ncbi:MAG: pentapeptide repeat-containing protein [Jatrophihabitans sp.]|uniref:pentapeptide repeat-containing protein n=1 Tax=Jatrophihabitans sp. TaxID=1932789 RepID=UPI003F7EE32E